MILTGFVISFTSVFLISITIELLRINSNSQISKILNKNFHNLVKNQKFNKLCLLFLKDNFDYIINNVINNADYLK